MKTFSIGDMLRASWDVTKKNYWLILGLVIISMIAGWLGELAPESILWQIIVTIIGIFIGLGTTRISLNIVDGKPAAINQLFSESSKFWNYLFATVLYGVLVIVGLLVLIIPGIYFAVKYAFAPYAVIDENMNAIDAFKRSSELTKGVKWQLIGFSIVLILLTLVSAIPLFLGLLATIPMAFISMTVVYRALQKQAGKTAKPATTTETATA